MCWIWLRFGFQLPKDLLLELTGKHLPVQSTVPGKLLVFGLGYTFLSKDWCTGYRAPSPSLKCYTLGANLKILLILTYSLCSPIYINFWITDQSLSQTLGIFSYINCISITKTFELTDVLHSEPGDKQIVFKILIQISPTKFLFPI